MIWTAEVGPDGASRVFKHSYGDLVFVVSWVGGGPHYVDWIFHVAHKSFPAPLSTPLKAEEENDALCEARGLIMAFENSFASCMFAIHTQEEQAKYKILKKAEEAKKNGQIVLFTKKGGA